jgi:hypothetical protein
MCRSTFYGNRITRQWAQIALATAFGPLSLVNANPADPDSRLVPTTASIAQNAVLAKALGQIDKMFTDWKLPTPPIQYTELAILLKADGSMRHFLTFAFPNAVRVQMIIDATPAESPLEDQYQGDEDGESGDDFDGQALNDLAVAPQTATQVSLPDTLETYWMNIR